MAVEGALIGLGQFCSSGTIISDKKRGTFFRFESEAHNRTAVLAACWVSNGVSLPAAASLLVVITPTLLFP